MPIRRGGSCVAALCLYSGEVGHFTSEERDLLEEIGAALTFALDAMDSAEANRAAEQERTRMESRLQNSEKLESLGRLAGGIAHDFNNMLTVILNHTYLAQTALPDQDPLREDLLSIQRAAERSADLTKQLLAFARKQAVSPRVIDLNATLSGSLRLLRRLIGENVELRWHPSPDAGWIRIDPSQLDQVLTNVTLNARDAIDIVGTITIETRVRTRPASQERGASETEVAEISVTDTGRGMAPGF